MINFLQLRILSTLIFSSSKYSLLLLNDRVRRPKKAVFFYWTTSALTDRVDVVGLSPFLSSEPSSGD
jgi:hypothetical protein